MATDQVKTDLRGLLAKIQAAAGTPETLSAATDGFLVLNGEFMFEVDPLEREIDRPGHGARPYVNVNKRARFDFGIELRGAATVGAAAPIGPLLRGAGFAQALTTDVSAIYSLVTSGHEILTMEGYRNGSKVTGHDCRGALTQIELSIRNFARARAQFMGLVGATPVADASLPAITLSSFQSPVPIETESFEVDIGGTKLNTISLTVDTNAQVEIYEGSESRFVFYREFYRPTGTLRVYKEQRSSFNPETVALSHALSDMYATITGGGEQIRLDLDSVQLGVPTDSDADGLAAWDIPFRAVGSTATDCLKLSFLVAP